MWDCRENASIWRDLLESRQENIKKAADDYKNAAYRNPAGPSRWNNIGEWLKLDAKQPTLTNKPKSTDADIPLLGRQPKTRIAGKQTRFLPKRKLPTRKLRKEKQVAMAKEQKTKGGNSSNLIKGLQELRRSKRVGTVVEKGETKDNTKRKANTGSNTPRKKIKRTAD